MAPKRITKHPPSKVPPSPYPAPFTKAPPSLEPFLGQLNPSQVYILHIDRHRPDYKKQIYFIAVFVNASIAAVLLWRLYAAAPTYLALAQTFLGYVSSATVDPTKTTRSEQVWILVRRTLMFLGDYMLYHFVTPWPRTFFFERPANPVSWRWTLGFPAKEVVVRVSRNWGASDLMKGDRRGEQSAFWKTRVLPAIEMQWMQKTGYLMMDASWDLDFGLMLDADTLVKKGEVGMEELDKVVFVHQEGSGWLVHIFRSEEVPEEENRKRMMAFKSYLSGLGKESLFWKWQAIVEEERNADGGFTPETQERLGKRVAEEFEKNGVDFDKAMENVGEVQAIPVSS